MKDITQMTFGTVVAFLLPGLVCFYGLIPLSKDVAFLSNQLVNGAANTGVILVVLLAGLVLGLFVSGVRWFIFEKWQKERIPDDDFTHATSARMEAFRAAVDQHYCYHQFWGGLAVAIAVVAVGYWRVASLSAPKFVIGTLLAEGLCALAAQDCWRKYVRRGHKILSAPHPVEASLS